MCLFLAEELLAKKKRLNAEARAMLFFMEALFWLM